MNRETANLAREKGRTNMENRLASNTKTDAAAAQFRKLQRDQDGRKAIAEYEAAGIATRAKTAKLKALRLARDAEVAAAAASSPAPGNVRKAKPKASVSSDSKTLGNR